MMNSLYFARSLLAVVSLLVISESVYAYLDPGTGSIILQGAIAAIALGLSSAKLWWYRVTNIFSRKKHDIDDDNDD